jgi:geranylgeranyl pyrophosphate synthase
MTSADATGLRAHWQAIKARFDAEAPRWVAQFFAASAGHDLPLIERLVVDGKTARGCLACLVCEALGGEVDDVMPRAVLLECVQAATLVHDDVVDGDALRRDRPAVWTVLGARRAVLLGDLMFATALMQASRLGHADVTALAEAIATVAGGAYREPLDGAELARVTASRGAATLYERVVHCKTGALFGVAGTLGAIAAGADPTRIQAARAFATRVGEAYQMADDIEDLLGPALGADAPQKLAALATLRAHFTATRNRMSPAFTGAAAGDAASDALRPHLKREIRDRVRLARSAIDTFASGTAAAWLHAAPGFIVNLQTPFR